MIPQMTPTHMNYPSPRGVHVPETYANDDYDPYRPPRRNRYSSSVRQTPRIGDVAWITSPEPTPQTPYAPPTPWMPPQQAPSSPAYRPASAAPPSPAPTVGEHMALDDFEHEMVDPYRPMRQRGGLFKSFWNGLKKFSRFQPPPYRPRPSSYGSQMMEMPVPVLSSASEGTQYVDPSPTETEEQRGATPYGSPYARPVHLSGSVVSAGSRRASPVPSIKIPSVRGSPIPMPMRSVETSPYVRLASLRATPAVPPGALRASLASTASAEVPIRVISPSMSPSPQPASRRSLRAAASPVVAIQRSPPQGGLEPGILAPPSPMGEGSQTLHEPAPVLPRLDTRFPPGPLGPTIQGPKAGKMPEPLSPDGSLASTIAQFRRFVTGLDNLPWVSDEQIADEYVPADNPRSRMRGRLRRGADPSWYNARPEVIDRPPYLSEWDMWAMQSAAALWDGKGTRPREWGVMYPRGYVGSTYPRRPRQ